jgi:hypothetical protein
MSLLSISLLTIFAVTLSSFIFDVSQANRRDRQQRNIF